jgi:hypothetical protein
MTTKKLSPAMIDALDGFVVQGKLSSGIMPDWMIRRSSTHCALIDRGLVSSPIFSARVQITPAGCKAIGHSMDEIVAWAYDAAMKEYAERCTAEPDSWYNPMTHLPIAIGAVVEIANSGVRGTITSEYQGNWWIHGANDSDRRCVGTRGLVHLRVIELAPSADTHPSADEAYDGQAAWRFRHPAGTPDHVVQGAELSTFAGGQRLPELYPW